MEENDFDHERHVTPFGHLSDQDCDRLVALIPAYSIGATDPDETRLVESLLPGCPEAAAQLEAYQRLSQQLLFSVPPTTAPAHLREKLLAAVEKPQRADIKRMPARPRWQLAGVVLAVLLVLLSNLYWVMRTAAQNSAQAAAERQLADHREMLAMIGAGETHRMDLSNADRTLSAVMLCDPDQSLGLIYVEDFPSAPPGMVYQVWLIRDGQQVNVGSFVVDEDGNGMLIFRAEEALIQYDSAEITLESSGAARPTSPALVAGPITY